MAMENQDRYQIKRAIAQLEEAPSYKHKLNIPTVHIIETVIAQLKAYLEKTKI